MPRAEQREGYNWGHEQTGTRTSCFAPQTLGRAVKCTGQRQSNNKLYFLELRVYHELFTDFFNS